MLIKELQGKIDILLQWPPRVLKIGHNQMWTNSTEAQQNLCVVQYIFS